MAALRALSSVITSALLDTAVPSPPSRDAPFPRLVSHGKSICKIILLPLHTQLVLLVGLSKQVSE